jgi:hypothetical protein
MPFSPTSFVLGVTAAWLVPVVARVGRTLAVEATAVGFAVFDDVRRAVAQQLETLEDIAAEARARRDTLVAQANGFHGEHVADGEDGDTVAHDGEAPRVRRRSASRRSA